MEGEFLKCVCVVTNTVGIYLFILNFNCMHKQRNMYTDCGSSWPVTLIITVQLSLIKIIGIQMMSLFSDEGNRCYMFQYCDCCFFIFILQVPLVWHTLVIQVGSYMSVHFKQQLFVYLCILLHR